MKRGLIGFEKNASKPHKTIANLLKSQSVKWQVVQNKPIDIFGKTLYIDFYISRPFEMAIEVDGEQHEKYNGFFYETEDDFLNAKKNDMMKEEWCRENNIAFLRIKFSDFKPENFNSMILETLKKYIEEK